jgi:hypothetical protein
MDKVGEDEEERLVTLSQCPTIPRPGTEESSPGIAGKTNMIPHIRRGALEG